MRTFTVKSEKDLKTLRASLLDARFTDAQAEATLTHIKKLNPNIDLNKLSPGTVLFVPEAEVKTAQTDSLNGQAVDEFRRLFSTAFGEAIAEMRVNLTVRTGERGKIAEAFKSEAFKRAVASDKQLAGEAEDAQKRLALDEAEDKQSEAALAAIGKSALDAIARMSKLLG